MYKPSYGESYYTIEVTKDKEADVVVYKWLDLDDDEKLFNKELVFKTYEDACIAAERLGYGLKASCSI